MAFSMPSSFPSYSHAHGIGCDYCGKILSRVTATQPRPCFVCGLSHYCSQECFIAAYRTRHRPQCKVNLDVEVDLQGAQETSTQQALADLRKYTARWRDELGDAAIDAMNLHFDPAAIDRQALVVNLSYVPNQWRPMQRFRMHSAHAVPLSSLTRPGMDVAKLKRDEYTARNKNNGMVGCALIILTCDVPLVGSVWNSTFVGPEPSLLVDPPAERWQQRLLAEVRVNEP